MADLLPIIAALAGGGLITALVAIFKVRAERNHVTATTSKTAAETEATSVETMQKVLGMVEERLSRSISEANDLSIELGRAQERADKAERSIQDADDRERRLQAEIVVLRSSGETDAIMRGILDAAPDAMMLVNRHGVIEAANIQAERMFRYTPGSMRGTPVDELVPIRLRESHAEHRATYMENPSVRPMGLGTALFAQRSDGSELSVEISLSPYQAAGEYPKVVCSVRDMTGRVRPAHHGVH